MIDRVTMFSPEAIRAGLFPFVRNGLPVARLLKYHYLASPPKQWQCRAFRSCPQYLPARARPYRRGVAALTALFGIADWKPHAKAFPQCATKMTNSPVGRSGKEEQLELFQPRGQCGRSRASLSRSERCPRSIMARHSSPISIQTSSRKRRSNAKVMPVTSV